jgi:hypothetical protein
LLYTACTERVRDPNKTSKKREAAKRAAKSKRTAFGPEDQIGTFLFLLFQLPEERKVHRVRRVVTSRTKRVGSGLPGKTNSNSGHK